MSSTEDYMDYQDYYEDNEKKILAKVTWVQKDDNMYMYDVDMW